nr:multidrug resistance-associated protein 3 [Tanacetum cinerariifolium]GEZ36731.1 multidrug resistance-associated protein 3 [Tanacetum cinerariifolium]
MSFDGIATLLRLNDIDLNAIKKIVIHEILYGNFAWNLNTPSNLTLKDINIRVNHGMRIAICGIVKVEAHSTPDSWTYQKPTQFPTEPHIVHATAHSWVVNHHATFWGFPRRLVAGDRLPRACFVNESLEVGGSGGVVGGGSKEEDKEE